MVRCTRRHGFENFAYMRYAKTLLKTFASAVVFFYSSRILQICLKVTNVREVCHIWTPRKYQYKNKEPIICPKCKCPYWNIPKK